MEYTRLTEKDWHKEKFYPTTDNERAIRKRLWDLENQIEQGTLIELPCKMDKQMIEEVYKMAKIALGKQITKDCTEWAIEEGFFDNFVSLYNAGYREIPENAVVLTREEYDGKGIIVEMSNGHKLKLSVGKFGEMSKILEEHTRKETAKECYEKMLEDCPIICDEEHTYSEFVKHYKNWLKERFGVEME